MTIVLMSALLCACLAGALVVVMRRMSASSHNVPLTADWIDELSIERYCPMMRLLDGADLEFLQSQPGCTAAHAAKLRIQRCQIFRGYLRSLSVDFRRICGAIRILMLQSNRDRPDLAALLRHQLLFTIGLVNV